MFVLNGIDWAKDCVGGARNKAAVTLKFIPYP